jgi:hypothetical protein
VSQNGQSVYVTNSGSETVSQYTVGVGGQLTPKVPATVPAGKEPFGATVSADGKSLFVANLSSATISQYAIAPDGSLTPHLPAAVGASGLGPTMVALSPDGASAYVPILEGARIDQFSVEAGRLFPKVPFSVPAGIKPVHAAVVTPPEAPKPPAGPASGTSSTPQASSPIATLRKGTVRFAKVKKDPVKGTAELTVAASGAGLVTLAKTKSVKGARARAKGQGNIKLVVRPKGKALKRLNQNGQVIVTAKVNFTLDGGAPVTVSKPIALLKAASP